MGLLKCTNFFIGDFKFSVLVITIFVILELFVVFTIVATKVTLLLAYVTLICEYHDAYVRTTVFLHFLQPAVNVLE